MHGRDGVALDARDARGGRVEQRVDQVIGQQVDLVHVEDALVRAREQAASKAFSPFSARPRSSAPTRRSRLAPSGSSTSVAGRSSTSASAARARRRELARREREGLPAGDGDGWQQRREAAHRRRLGRPALPPHEHAADLRARRR